MRPALTSARPEPAEGLSFAGEPGREAGRKERPFDRLRADGSGR